MACESLGIALAIIAAAIAQLSIVCKSLNVEILLSVIERYTELSSCNVLIVVLWSAVTFQYNLPAVDWFKSDSMLAIACSLAWIACSACSGVSALCPYQNSSGLTTGSDCVGS
jgi:hypothetical protein